MNRNQASLPSSHSEATLLINCPDRTGIVATLSRFISDNRGNIVSVDQHSEDADQNERGGFFIRLRWTLDKFRLNHDQIVRELKRMGKSFKWNFDLHYSNEPQHVAVFVSREAHCLYDLLHSQVMGELHGEIRLVVSNHPQLRSVAEHFSVPFFVIPVEKKKKREAEEIQRQLLTSYDVHLIVLAKYMQILSPHFLRSWQNQIINVHHSFLPAFVGPKPYHQARSRGVKVIGATSHYVTGALDQGPIIAQSVTPVSHRDGVKELIRKGRDLERQVLSSAVRAHLDHRILTQRNRTVVFEA